MSMPEETITKTIRIEKAADPKLKKLAAEFRLNEVEVMSNLLGWLIGQQRDVQQLVLGILDANLAPEVASKLSRIGESYRPYVRTRPRAGRPPQPPKNPGSIWVRAPHAGRTVGSGLRLARAFTLIELLVVIAIVALLLAITLPTLAGARAVSRNARCLTNERSIIARARATPVFPVMWTEFEFGPDEAAALQCPAGPVPVRYTWVPELMEFMDWGDARRYWTVGMDSLDWSRVSVIRDTTPHRNVGYLDGHACRR